MWWAIPPASSNRPRDGVAALVLPGRTLVPIGLMPVASHGAPRLMFCRGGAFPETAVRQGRHRHTADTHCAYALSGGAALLADVAPAPRAAPAGIESDAQALPTAALLLGSVARSAPGWLRSLRTSEERT